MLADGLVLSGVALGVLTFLDIFLSELQKSAIADRVLQLWHLLSNLKNLSFLHWIRKPKFLLLFAAIVSALGFIPVTFIGLDVTRNRLDMFSIILLGAFFVGVLMAGVTSAWGLSFALKADSPRGISLRAIGLALAASAPAAITIAFAFHREAQGRHPLSDSVFLVTCLVASVLLLVAAVYVFVILLPLLTIFILTTFLICMEFVVRRIAEYPKGPLLALSATATAIGGTIKALVA